MSESAEIGFEVRAVLARIDRDLAEQQKLMAKQRKLFAEELKLRSEDIKLRSESRKLDRDRLLAPWLAILGLPGVAITVRGAIWRALSSAMRGNRPLITLPTSPELLAKIDAAAARGYVTRAAPIAIRLADRWAQEDRAA